MLDCEGEGWPQDQPLCLMHQSAEMCVMRNGAFFGWPRQRLLTKSRMRSHVAYQLVCVFECRTTQAVDMPVQN